MTPSITTITRCCRTLVAHGLSLQQALILFHAGEGSPKMSDFADMLSLTTAAITGQVDVLQKRGLVQREYGEGDRWCIRVVLTGSGRELVEKVGVTFSEQ